MKKVLACIAVALALSATALMGQSRIVKEFGPVCDTLDILIQEKTSVKNELVLKSVMKRGKVLDLYFNRSLGDVPWHQDTYRWFKDTVKQLFPEEYSRYGLGEIYCGRTRMSRLVTNIMNNDGTPDSHPYRKKDPRTGSVPIVENLDAPEFTEGLSGRHIALWQSHGRYFEQKTLRWEWQRACLFQTVEDMLTPGFVLPFLVPMLENAGCYVFLPRERDIQSAEVIADNDPHFTCQEIRHIRGDWGLGRRRVRICRYAPDVCIRREPVQSRYGTDGRMHPGGRKGEARFGSMDPRYPGTR